MCPTPNGSGGPELEKFPDSPAPPTIAITAPVDVPDAGLRSLDHCKFFPNPALLPKLFWKEVDIGTSVKCAAW
jgi:hypothetical protein